MQSKYENWTKTVKNSLFTSFHNVGWFIANAGLWFADYTYANHSGFFGGAHYSNSDTRSDDTLFKQTASSYSTGHCHKPIDFY